MQLQHDNTSHFVLTLLVYSKTITLINVLLGFQHSALRGMMGREHSIFPLKNNLSPISSLKSINKNNITLMEISLIVIVCGGGYTVLENHIVGA